MDGAGVCQRRNCSLGVFQRRNCSLGVSQRRNCSLEVCQRQNCSLGVCQRRNCSLGAAPALATKGGSADPQPMSIEQVLQMLTEVSPSFRYQTCRFLKLLGLRGLRTWTQYTTS